MKFITEITVIWTNRKQNLKESTEDIIVFLERLKKFDINFGSWYNRGNSRKEAMQSQVQLEYDFIKKKLCKKCNDSDYPEFSFLTGFWNGALSDSLSYGIRFSIGGEGKIGTNNCVLTFPYEGELYEHYSVKKNWEQLLELFIDHWKPDQYRDFDDKLVEI